MAELGDPHPGGGGRGRTSRDPGPLLLHSHGAPAWFCIYESGVHPTLVGVALAFLTPPRPMYSAEVLHSKGQAILDSSPRHIVTEQHRSKPTTKYWRWPMWPESRCASCQERAPAACLSSFLVLPIFALAMPVSAWKEM